MDFPARGLRYRLRAVVVADQDGRGLHVSVRVGDREAWEAEREGSALRARVAHGVSPHSLVGAIVEPGERVTLRVRSDLAISVPFRGALLVEPVDGDDGRDDAPEGSV
jgi:hypothetical protein